MTAAKHRKTYNAYVVKSYKALRRSRKFRSRKLGRKRVVAAVILPSPPAEQVEEKEAADDEENRVGCCHVNMNAESTWAADGDPAKWESAASRLAAYNAIVSAEAVKMCSMCNREFTGVPRWLSNTSVRVYSTVCWQAACSECVDCKRHWCDLARDVACRASVVGACFGCRRPVCLSCWHAWGTPQQEAEKCTECWIAFRYPL